MIKKVLSRIVPTKVEEDRIERISKELINLIEVETKTIDTEIDVLLLGSVSRGTWLAHEKDIDLFIRFPTRYTKDELEHHVLALGRKLLGEQEKRFAEHPYVKGEYKGYSVEIVPCYSIDDPGKRHSAVDRTPFHNEYVVENLREEQRNEVRLLKQFLRGIGAYGAEIKVEGFSGYLCELLIIEYGSFQKTLEAARYWKPHNKVSPMVFLDPVDEKRNVASALSIEKYNHFVYAAGEYLKKPMENFFFPNKRSLDPEGLMKDFNKRGTAIISIRFPLPHVVDEILYSQIKKAERFFEKMLKTHDFNPIGTGFDVKAKGMLVFELERLNISPILVRKGPKVNSKNQENFLKKHIGSDQSITRPYIKEDRWEVLLLRQHCNATTFLKDFIQKGDLRKKGVPSHIARSLEQACTIKKDGEAIKEDPDFFLNFLNPIFSWEA